MASIANDPKGRKRIITLCPDGERRAIRLGKVDQRTAQAVKFRIEKLYGAIRTDSPLDDDTANWLVSIDDALHKTLTQFGFCAARAEGRATLKAFIDQTIALSMKNAKPNTKTNIRQTQDWLVKFFGENRDMRTIHQAEAEDWESFMQDDLADATLRRHIGRARQIWRRAMTRGMVKLNPFLELSASVRSDQKRKHFIDRATITKVLEACPDAEWKLIVALARYGGLRTPSEPLAMVWSDIDWDRNRIRVPSPKTEHIEGHEDRIIPLFPELRPYLLAAFEAAEDGVTHVIARYRDKYTNLRTQFGRILVKAGVDAWPKPFHNLRASRETELNRQHPEHVVCAWIGNSRKVAKESYLMLTDHDFDQAAQNQARAAVVTDGQEKSNAPSEAPEMAVCEQVTTGDNTSQGQPYPQQGLNYRGKTTGKRVLSGAGGAPSGARTAAEPNVERAIERIRRAIGGGK